MSIQDLMKNIKSMTSEQIERRFNELVRENYHFKNLSSDNKETVMDLVLQYRDIIKQGREISSLRLRDDMHHLYEKRISLKLSEGDLEDIKKILESFVS